ncbi:MAG: hypothetical protein Q9188_006878 [Gyalolechia gomerana]
MHHDRIYYEINWQFARNVLCRKFVKGIRNEGAQAPEYEHAELAKFQEYLFDASLQHELRWSFLSTGSSSPGKFLAGKAFAIVLRLDKTSNLTKSTRCQPLWGSEVTLLHRRTVILFNELQSAEDVVSFTDWLSPAADMSLWDSGHPTMPNTDDERTALRFLQNFLYRVWSGVNLKWDILFRCAEEHLASVDAELAHASSANNLQELQYLVQQIGQDSSTWYIIIRLLRAQHSSLRRTKSDLRALIMQYGFEESKKIDPLAGILRKLESLEQRVANDFREQTKNLTGLAYNAIAIYAAQNSLNHSASMRRLSWITFIFLPLVFSASIFGMNVDVLANDPPLKWYFVSSVPLMGVLVVVTIALRNISFSNIKSRIWRVFRSDEEGEADELLQEDDYGQGRV